MKYKLLSFVGIFLFINNFCAQIAGSLDPNFANNGTLIEPTVRGYFPYDIAIQKNSGEIFIAGVENPLGGPANGVIKRLDFYGNSVTSFGVNGVLNVSFPEGKLQSIYQIEPDDPTVGTTGFYTRGFYKDIISNNNINYISKHFADGSLDTSYGNGGKLLITGKISGNYIYSLDLNSFTGHQFLKRYHLQTGVLDQTFANIDLPIADSIVHFLNDDYIKLNIQANGKIVLVGYKIIGQFEKSPAIARFNSNGTIDTSFGNSGYVFADSNNPPSVESITQSDGKIIYIDGSGNFFRLKIDGSVDNSYGVNGRIYINNTGCDLFNWAYHLKIQNDNKIYFGGEILNNYCNGGETSSQYEARLNTDGTFDFITKSFNSYYSEIWSSALIDQSFLLTAGTNTQTNENWERVIQRIYTNTPIFSLFGAATGNNDINLATADNTLFTGAVNLIAGSLKFRLNHNNDFNWGGSNFPSGQSTMGQEEIQIPTSGIYNVTFNLKNGEYAFSTKLSTNDSIINSVKVFPNPATDEIRFSEEVSDVVIYDQSGKLIYNRSKKLERLDLSNFPAGLYKVTFKTKNDSIVTKNVLKK